jgi:hypothetical protein
MERRPDVEMDWKCRRSVTASIADWPFPLPVCGLEIGAMRPAPAPARNPLLVLTATKEPMMLPTTRMVVAALVMEMEDFSASMSSDSPGRSI